MEREVLADVVSAHGLELETVLAEANGDVNAALCRVLDGDNNVASLQSKGLATSSISALAGADCESKPAPELLKARNASTQNTGKKRKQTSMHAFFEPVAKERLGKHGALYAWKVSKTLRSDPGESEEVRGEEKEPTEQSHPEAKELLDTRTDRVSSRTDAPVQQSCGADIGSELLKNAGKSEPNSSDGACMPIASVDSPQKHNDLDARGQHEHAPAKEEPKPCEVETRLLDASFTKTPLPTKGRDFAGTNTAYDPLTAVEWANDEPTPYIHLAQTFEIVARTSSRTQTIQLLSDMLRSVLRRTPSDLLSVLYLCTSQLAPSWEGLELSFGGSSLAQAIREATGVSRQAMSAAYVRLGDIGDVAQELRVAVRTIAKIRPLSVSKVYKTLLEMAKDGGPGSQARKKTAATRLFVACRGVEIRWIVRTLVQNMRMGAVLKTLLVALARAVVLELDRDSSESDLLAQATIAIVGAFSRCPSFEVLSKALLADGSWRNCEGACEVRPGTPMKPQLGKITRDPAELLKRFGDVRITCEFKYDGQRAQIHLLEDRSLKVFSRHLEDVTGRYGGIVTATAAASDPKVVQTAVLDAEVVAVDRSQISAGGDVALLPFQTLSARSKKVDVCVMAFDLLYLNGRSLLKESLATRRELLQTHFTCTPGEFSLVEEKTVAEPGDVQQWLDQAIEKGAEGLMCKTLDGSLATYEPALRSEGWAKIKKDYVDGMTGSLDLIPIGAWWGNGRKAGWFSPFLCACYHDGELQSLCKVMSGFSDAQYRELTAFYSDGRTLKEKPPHYVVGPSMFPSVWFEACQVWEVKGADFTLSPVHMAGIGMVNVDRGVSVRFPRFIGVRDDKDIEDATSSDEIANLYLSQPSLAGAGGGETGE